MENQFAVKSHESHALKQDSGKEIQAGHFQNQKRSTCISRIQSNNDCGGNPNRYHSLVDDRYDCIPMHKCFVFQTVTGSCFSFLSRRVTGVPSPAKERDLKR